MFDATFLILIFYSYLIGCFHVSKITITANKRIFMIFEYLSTDLCKYEPCAWVSAFKAQNFVRFTKVKSKKYM